MHSMNTIEIIGNTNLFTPNILRYGHINKIIYELSEGTGMDQNPIFGVTIRRSNTGETEYKSKLFYSIEEAEEYIKFIQVQELLGF